MPANHGKTRRSLFTEERLANLHQNVERHQWARQVSENFLTIADQHVDKPYAELVSYVTDPCIPRAIYVHETECPICGLELRKHGWASWITTKQRPFKVECPHCHQVFPSNDFEAYYASGMKDRSLLTGDYPDDGYGWSSPDDPKHKYWFVGFYTQWMVMRELFDIIDGLYHAYLFTDDERYAHKCAALIWQLASFYPDYNYATQSRYGIEFDANYNGKLLYHTWENWTVDRCAQGYDAIFPALNKPCPELEAFTGQTTAQIRHLIEEQLLRDMARHIVEQTGYIYGNYGMHQSSLLRVAATLRDTTGQPSSQDMVDWVMDNEDYDLYVYMPLYDALYNLVGRDGCATESPQYNNGWTRNLTHLADLLQLNGVDVTQIERFQQLYEWAPRMICAGEFVPALGDAFTISHRAQLCTFDNYLFAYKTYKKPLYAHILRGLEPDRKSNLFARPVSVDELDKVAAVGSIGHTSQHLAEYRQAILQNANVDQPLAVSMHYGQNQTHDHRDKMQLDIYAHGASLIPDFGYPETANANDPRRGGFFHHTISHNTVMVDERRQQASHEGYCIAFDPGGVCAYMEADGKGAYPQIDMYRRGVALIEGDDSGDYIIDLFRVQGGRQHDWLVHGTKATFDSNLPFSEPRTKGTLAGPEVPYGFFYDDPDIRDLPEGSTNYFRYCGSSFQFLYNSQEAHLQPDGWVRCTVAPQAEPTLPVHVTADEGTFLKAHLIGHQEHIFAADGKPQQHYDTAPESVKFLIRRRVGEQLSSNYATVFEPGAGDSFIDRVTRLDTGLEHVIALRILLKSGEVHYYLNAASAVEEHDVADGLRFSGRVGFVALDRDGQILRAYAHHATLLRGAWRLDAPGPLQRTVIACDYDGNRITLDGEVPDTALGRTLVMRSGSYTTTFVAIAIPAPDTIQLDGGLPAAGRLTIGEIDGEARRLYTPTEVTRAAAGMYLVTAALDPVAQTVEGTDRTHLVLDRSITMETFDHHGDNGVRRAWLMPYGPGTLVEIPNTVRFLAD
jgi:hypothetical protein